MLIPKGDVVELGRRIRLDELVAELQDSSFTGYVEVSYRSDEISKGKILFRNGDIVAASVVKLMSKREAFGDAALNELMAVDSCVADIYSLPDEKVEKAMAWNKKALVSSLPQGRAEVVDREELLRKYGIKIPSPEEIDAIIENALKEPLGDVEDVKRLIEKSFGKMGRKLLQIVDRCSSVEELAEVFPELEREAKKLTLFLPKKRVVEVLERIRELAGL